MNAEGLTAGEVTDLYAKYGALVRRRCRLLLRDGQLADDAVQETFVRAMQRGELLREMDLPLRWLHRVADRCCFDQLRKGHRLRLAVSLEGTPLPGPHPGIAIETRDAVLAVLRDLEPRDQEIAVMAFVDGMTQEAIAAEIGVSRVTVNKRVQTLRERAARLLVRRES